MAAQRQQEELASEQAQQLTLTAMEGCAHPLGGSRGALLLDGNYDDDKERVGGRPRGHGPASRSHGRRLPDMFASPVLAAERQPAAPRGERVGGTSAAGAVVSGCLQR